MERKGCNKHRKAISEHSADCLELHVAATISEIDLRLIMRDNAVKREQQGILSAENTGIQHVHGGEGTWNSNQRKWSPTV